MTARAMRLAALMLAATVLLGLILLSNHAFGWWLQARETLADLHLTWGLLGWVGILIVGVAYQVVPMFQLTPAYPAKAHALAGAGALHPAAVACRGKLFAGAEGACWESCWRRALPSLR